jgi:NAD(P)H-dependent flavin oxidoreductase YrpB (nitropropane dioxygenase family)
VNALGAPPRDVVDRCHQQGLVVGALVGSLEHGARQRDAGVDFLVAQGAEAGGHVGTISSMVLWPQLVDAMAPIPVLAAGGIGRGRQMAAALALGADGVWCGSIWLGTRESELSPEMKERLFAANSEDAIVTRALTGKPCRALRSRYTEAWEQPGAPAPLPLPLQSFLYGEPSARIARAHASDFMTYAVGQIVGDMAEETSVRRVIQGMLEEFADAIERLNRLADMD